MPFDKGEYGENIAEGYLREKGYEILNRRYRCPCGEIDLVAKLGGTIAFIEVKLRKSRKAGLAAEAVTKSKRQAIIRTASHYIDKNGGPCGIYRFDVVEVLGREFYMVNHIENAFYAESEL